MKRGKCVAGILVATVLMSGCTGTKETRVTRTTKNTEETTTEESSTTEETTTTESTTEETTTSESTTEETTTSESTTKETTEETTSESTAESTSDETTISEPFPTFNLADDYYSLYADASYKLPEVFDTCLSAGTASWEQSITFNTKVQTFAGQFESRTLNLNEDPESYDIYMCTVKAEGVEFERRNNYSFAATVGKIDVREFDDYDGSYGDTKAHYHFSKPYKLEEKDELILFLPNTPMPAFPSEAMDWVGMYLPYTDGDYLQAFVLYDATSKVAYSVYLNSIPETEEVSGKTMDGWTGDYTFENGEFSNRCITIHETDYSRYVRRALKEFGLSYREADSMVYDAGGMEIVAEKVLRASYIMVDAKGWLVDDSRNDSYTMISDCLTEPFADGYSRLPLNRENYMKRYEEALQDPRLQAG